MIVQPANRTSSVREYYFSWKNKELSRLNADRKARGEDPIINLGIGAPDRMPPMPAINELVSTARQPGNHAYQNYYGLPELRKAYADWYAKWYGVELDQVNGVQPLVGSKEGILLTSMAFVNPGDKVLVPDPGYPTYTSASRLVDAQIMNYDLTEENNWMPDFDAIEKMNLDGVKIMWVNYPHMPTGAKATPELFQRLVDFGLRHKILIVNDNPYSFILTERQLSILSAKGAMECCLELNSLSKAHNMSGWRIGMVGGSPEMVDQVRKVKSQMDSGMFKPLQLAAVQALSQGEDWFRELNAEYSKRQVAAGRIMDLLEARYDKNSAGLFLWGKVKAETQAANGMTAGETLSEKLLHEAGVFVTPGYIFGKNGNDYIRISLCAPVPTLEKAYEKIKGIL